MLDWEKEWHQFIYKRWQVAEKRMLEGDYADVVKESVRVFESILKNILKKYQTELTPEVQMAYLQLRQEKKDETLGPLIGFWRSQKLVPLLAQVLGKDPVVISTINMGYIGKLRNGEAHLGHPDPTLEDAKYCMQSTELLLGFFDLKYYDLTKVLFLNLQKAKQRMDSLKSEKSSALPKFPIQKLIYYKILNLKLKGDEPPVYTKYISRTEKDVDVYDEVFSFAFEQLASVEKEVKLMARSIGVVEKTSLVPFQKELVFNDKDERFIENYLQQVVRKEHISALSMGTTYNGLQPGHQDLAFKMSRDVESAVLIVDFSSIPKSDRLLKVPPKGVLCSQGVENKVNVEELSKNVFFIEEINVKKDSVIRMDFDFDWETR